MNATALSPQASRCAISPSVSPLLLALAAAFAPPALADDATPALKLAPVVVTGSRVEHSSFDLPASIDVVDRERIGEGQTRVNASEALVAVPGLIVQNRQNYAQDLQMSSRGFGARSAFGVRGIRLIADGIPATMPDGQGQAATFNLDMAERIEVLRGPYSAIYGNHAGGVIQMFTRDGHGAPTVEGGVIAGSYGTRKEDLNAQGEAGGVGYVLDTSHFSTDGYRDHSAAKRDQSFAKLTMQPDEDSKLTLVANSLTQHDTQDALGLTWAGVQSNPRSADVAALTYNTRKSIDHVQGGLTYERRFGEDRLQFTAYTGNRQVTQFQAIPKSAQVNVKNSGGIADFDRDFSGIGGRWIGVRALAAGTLTTTAGLDYDRSRDDRRGYENFIGNTLGVQGTLRRKEVDVVTNLDPYVQAEWLYGAWGLTGGLRHSRVQIEVQDQYLSNGNDSGKLTYSQTTPMFGVVYKLNPLVNVYASAARGFETPTLNELFYSGSGNGFNFGLKPARSRHLEGGVKAIVGSDTQLNAAVFQVNTNDELVVDTAIGGRTSYKNASKTLRQGIELALDTAFSHSVTGRLAFTTLRAVYDESFSGGGSTIPSGNRIPGVPASSLFGDLTWKDAPTGLFAGVEVLSRSKVYVEDSNSQKAAPGYTVTSLRAGAEQRSGGWKTKEFVRLDNLFDRQYIGSVIVGDGNNRFYEPAPGRNWLLGASAQYSF